MQFYHQYWKAFSCFREVLWTLISCISKYIHLKFGECGAALIEGLVPIVSMCNTKLASNGIRENMDFLNRIRFPLPIIIDVNTAGRKFFF